MGKEEKDSVIVLKLKTLTGGVLEVRKRQSEVGDYVDRLVREGGFSKLWEQEEGEPESIKEDEAMS